MQPPQGSYPPNGHEAGPEQYDAPSWIPVNGDQTWVQRPISGQQSGMWQMPGQVPPPAQISPEMPPPPYAGGNFQANGPAYPGQGAPNGQPPANGGTGQSHPASGNGYQPPKTGMPRAVKRKGKGVYLVLALLVLAAAGFLLFRMLRPGSASYGYVRYGSKSALYSGDAVIVRSETVDTQENVTQIDFDVDEGEEVKRGTMVATIYTSGFNAKEWVTLQNYRNQIKDYHKILIASASTDTNLLSRMTQVQDRAMEVQRLIHGAQGSISTQEKLLTDAMQSQQIYIKQKYPDEQKLSRLYDDENTQKQRISTWTKQFAATADGYVSFYTDGYEKALNMTTFKDFSPAEVRQMFNGQAPKVESSVVSRNNSDIYRLVRKEPWAILMLCQDKNWTPAQNHIYNLVIESYDGYVLSARVESFARSGGELLVRLVVEDASFLPNVLYLRSCQVRLGENVNSLMVPSRAIYVQNGRKGVVMYTEGGEYWTGVEVISDDGNTAYVVPDNASVLYDGVPVRLF